jgi:hypothetical protein
MLIGKYSSSAHELLLHLLVGQSRMFSAGCCWAVLGRAGRCQLLHMRLEPPAAQPVGDPEGPGKGSATQRQLETLRGGMQVRATPRRATPRVRDDLRSISQIVGDHAQQLFLGGSLPAPHTGADRTGAPVGLGGAHHAGPQIVRTGNELPGPSLTCRDPCTERPSLLRVLSPAPRAAAPPGAPRRSGCRSASR